MPKASDLSAISRYRTYRATILNATIALEDMKALPPEQRAKALAATVQAVINALRSIDGDLPADTATELLDAIAAGGQP